MLGRAELDTLLSERDRLNDELQRIIDEQTEPWGIKVTTVEIKDVEIPQTMQRAMARQAEAERERRAKIIAAEGEFQASDKLAQAAAKIGKHPVAIQLRFLQTLVEVGSERNSTTIFPVPIDLFQPVPRGRRSAQRGRRSGPPPPDLSGAEPRASHRPAHGAEGRAGARARGAAAQLRAVASVARTGAASECPLCEGREELDAARDLGDAARAAASRTRPAGWCARCRTSTRCWRAGRRAGVRAGRTRSTRGRGEPDLFASAPAVGVARGDRPRPAAPALDERPRARSSSSLAIGAGASGAARTAGARLRPRDGERGTGRRRLARAHPRAAVRARRSCRRVVARERERFTAHNTRTMGGCLLCDLLQEEVRRRERVVAVDDEAVLLAPYASRMPYELQLVPRRHEPSFARRRDRRAALLHEGLDAAARVLGAPPPLNLWVRTAPARRRALPLAHRRRAAADAAGRLRAGRRRRREHLAPERAAAELRERSRSH